MGQLKTTQTHSARHADDGYTNETLELAGRRSRSPIFAMVMLCIPYLEDVSRNHSISDSATSNPHL